MTLKKIEFARAWADKAVADYLRTEVSIQEGPSASWAWWRFGLEYVTGAGSTYIQVPLENAESLHDLALIDDD
ncbi:MAG: hypothetical protein RLZZ528_6, partial [Pseudomonadota bacterium]